MTFKFPLKSLEVFLFMGITLKIADPGKDCRAVKKKKVTTLSTSKLQTSLSPYHKYQHPLAHKPFNLFLTKSFMPGIHLHMHLHLFFTANYHPALTQSLPSLPGHTHSLEGILLHFSSSHTETLSS